MIHDVEIGLDFSSVSCFRFIYWFETLTLSDEAHVHSLKVTQMDSNELKLGDLWFL